MHGTEKISPVLIQLWMEFATFFSRFHGVIIRELEKEENQLFDHSYGLP